jgi:choline transport protein
MCTWEAVFFANFTAMINGGSPTLIYGFVFCFFGTLATAASLAEMASFAPTSGGQYHWVSMLAPKKYSNFLSWITGWIATLGWNANTAAGVFFSGTMIQGLLVLNYPSYDYKQWHGTMLMWAALLVCVFINTIAARFLPKIEGVILILHTLGFFAILIPLVILAPKGSVDFVFKDFVNQAGWNSNGLAFFVGLISGNLPFVGTYMMLKLSPNAANVSTGYDGPCHMAEEVQNASVIVPWCMVTTIFINGALGLAICIAFSFTIGDVTAALGSPTGYDFIEVFYNATASLAGSSVMTSILIALVTCASFGFLATASRQTWAFARDRGLPFSDFLSHVGDSALPLRSVLFCAAVTGLICLINIGSTVAFNAIVSITIAGLFISYMIPIILMITKRLKHEPVRMGPWTLGRAGLPVNIIAVCFLLISVFFSFWPPATPVTVVTMNWSCAVFGGVVIIGLIWYGIYGRKGYNGPIIERPILLTDHDDGVKNSEYSD